MMKLLIRQRVFSWTDTYDVYDEFGEARYFVKGEFFSLGHKIHVYDKRTGQELGAIHQRLLTLLPTFEIIMNGRVMGTVRKELSLFRPRYDVAFCGWEAEGNFFEWDYRVTENGREVMTISKEIISWGDTYTLDICDPAHEMPGLLLVLAIDAANCSHSD